FFFKAEDGIRDATVTGVQTCALPILAHKSVADALQAQPGARIGDGKLACIDGGLRIREAILEKATADARRRKGGGESIRGVQIQIGRASCRERVRVRVGRRE